MMSRGLAAAALVLILIAGGADGSAQGRGASQNPAVRPVDRSVTVNGLRIHYLDWGNPGKQPFIMLHGIGRVAHTFDHVAAAFRDDYHVIAVDMRGHGDSDWDPGAAYLVQDYVKDIEGLVDQLKLRNIVMLGNSTGGRVIQVYAGLHPDLVAGLIVEDVGAERPKNVADNFARTVVAEANGWSSEDELVGVLKTRNPNVSEELLRNLAHFGTKRTADGRVVWKRDPNLAKGFIETELWQYVRKIACPTIYVIGGRSTIVPAEAQEQLKQTVPGVQMVVMPGLGHYPDEEAPAEFLAIAKRFLTTMNTKPASLTKPRIPPRAESEWSDADRALAATFSRDRGAGNDFKTFLNEPELVRGVMPFVNYVSQDSTLSPRHREILILRTAWLCRSEYAWAHHVATARKAGLTDAEIHRIAEGPDARGWDGFEATLMRLADELHRIDSVSTPTWKALSARYDTRQSIDAVFAVTEFTMLSGAFNSIGVQLEPGVTARLPADVAYRIVVPMREAPLATARIAPLEPAEWTPEVRAMLDPVNNGGRVIALYRTFAQHPKFYPPRQLLSEHIRLHSTLSAHDRELLILRTGWLARAEYEWAQHIPTGRRAGLDGARIAAGPDAPGWDPFDVALMRAAEELYRNDFISDATWGLLAARYNASELMDALITAGGYRMVSMSANALGVQLETGAERFPAVSR